MTPNQLKKIKIAAQQLIIRQVLIGVVGSSCKSANPSNPKAALDFFFEKAESAAAQLTFQGMKAEYSDLFAGEIQEAWAEFRSDVEEMF